jgi:PBP1b-binding outer membrane lipoprotein LpoB
LKKTISTILLSLILTSCNKLSTISPYSDAASGAAQAQAPAVNNKESWSEWTSRQWKDNSAKWVSSIVGVTLIAVGCYYGYGKWSKSKNNGQPPAAQQPEGGNGQPPAGN